MIMKSGVNRSTDLRIEEHNRNQQVKPSHVTRIPKKPDEAAPTNGVAIHATGSAPCRQ